MIMSLKAEPVLRLLLTSVDGEFLRKGLLASLCASSILSRLLTRSCHGLAQWHLNEVIAITERFPTIWQLRKRTGGQGIRYQQRCHW